MPCSRLKLPVILLLLFFYLCPARLLAFDNEVFFNEPESVYGYQASYQVERNGKNIGVHTLQFFRQQEKLIVEAKSDLAVRLLGIPLYTYRYQSRETWEQGTLTEVDTSIFEHRKPERRITAQIQGKLLQIVKDGVSKSAPLAQFASNHWHPGVLSSQRVFHTLHARVHRVRVDVIGWEKVALTDGAVVAARHYRYSGGFKADVWYDKDRRWVRLEFDADDGSRIVYNCKTCGATSQQ